MYGDIRWVMLIPNLSTLAGGFDGTDIEKKEPPFIWWILVKSWLKVRRKRPKLCSWLFNPSERFFASSLSIISGVDKYSAFCTPDITIQYVHHVQANLN